MLMRINADEVSRLLYMASLKGLKMCKNWVPGK